MANFCKYKCIQCGAQTSMGTFICRLCREESKMGHVPVTTKWRCTHCNTLNLGSVNNCRNCSYPRYGVLPNCTITHEFKRPQLQEDEND